MCSSIKLYFFKYSIDRCYLFRLAFFDSKRHILIRLLIINGQQDVGVPFFLQDCK